MIKGSPRALSNKFPHLLEEWDYDKNEISPDEISYGSAKKVWWVCNVPECGYGWLSNTNNRTSPGRRGGCPHCVSKVVTEYNNLFAVRPDIAKEWHKIRNGDFTPFDILPGAERRAWWKCQKPECGYEWRAFINSRTKPNFPRGCPKCAVGNVSKTSQRWLDGLNVDIREHHIKGFGKRGFRVDGFDPETNTVYEFLGDYWHGNPERFKPEDFNKNVKKSHGQLYQETMERIEILKENGYKVIYIWEKDFRAMEKDGTNT